MLTEEQLRTAPQSSHQSFENRCNRALKVRSPFEVHTIGHELTYVVFALQPDRSRARPRNPYASFEGSSCVRPTHPLRATATTASTPSRR